MSPGQPTVPARRGMLLATLGTAAAALAGCVVVPANEVYDYDTDVIEREPPPPEAEVVGVAPVRGYVWIGGYWGWRGGRYYWVPGRWAAPRPGYAWRPHAWVRIGGGWRLRRGYWARR